MPDIANIGGYLDVDADGFIIKKASLALIQEQWKPVVDAAVDAYRRRFGEDLVAVYVRGSVAKGAAIDFVSDVDTIAIVTGMVGDGDSDWERETSTSIVARYPFVEKVEMLAITPEQAKDPKRGDRIMLKTQSVCVFGRDIAAGIPAVKIGRDAAQHVQGLPSELVRTIAFFDDGREADAVARRRKCGWIMKRILRTGFELVMGRERRYTRDLYPCYESFSRWYPERQERMRQTLELALNPTDGSAVILPILREWLAFMPKEIEGVCGHRV